MVAWIVEHGQYPIYLSEIWGFWVDDISRARIFTDEEQAQRKAEEVSGSLHEVTWNIT